MAPSPSLLPAGGTRGARPRGCAASATRWARARPCPRMLPWMSVLVRLLGVCLCSGFCHYSPLSAVQTSFSKVEVVVISLQIFKLNCIYIHIYNIYINIYYIFFAVDEAEKGYPLSHTHAAVKYKPLGKAQVRAGGAGSFSFLAERELEGGQSEKPNIQAMPGESSPGVEAPTSRGFGHLAKPSFALGICQCFALFCLGCGSGFWG